MTFSPTPPLQPEGKYLVQNRVTGEIYESAVPLHSGSGPACSRTIRVKRVSIYVKRFTMRFPTFKNFRCRRQYVRRAYPNPSVQLRVLIVSAWRQSDSINATSSATGNTFQSAPVSVSTLDAFARWQPDSRRAKRSTPAASRSTSTSRRRRENSARRAACGGAATPVLPDVAPEAESLLVLKTTVVRGRQPRTSHGLRRTDQQTDAYTRLLKGGDITLFSPSDVPGLYDAFLRRPDESSNACT